MDLFPLKAEMLPWFFMMQTFLLEGELPVLDFMGVVFGHWYYHLQKTGKIGAPRAVTKWYEEGEDGVARWLRGQ